MFDMPKSKISSAMERLRPEHQDVLILITIQGMSYRDAANVLCMTTIQVRELLSEAREALDELLVIPAKKIKYFMPPPRQLDFVPAYMAAAA